MRAPALTLALCLTPLAAPAQDLPEVPEITALAEPWIDDTTPGLAVLVLQEGEVLHFSGLGVADIDSGRPVDADTLFDLASVSKQMTALMAAIQIEQGLYDLDTPVADFFPAFAAGDEAGVLTVGHLIHHTGGLADYLNEFEGLTATTENPEVVAWLADQPFAAPRERPSPTRTRATSCWPAWWPRRAGPARSRNSCRQRSGAPSA